MAAEDQVSAHSETAEGILYGAVFLEFIMVALCAARYIQYRTKCVLSKASGVTMDYMVMIFASNTECSRNGFS